MKKILFLLTILVTMTFTSCNRCAKQESQVEPVDTVDVENVDVPNVEMNVEHIIATDRQEMFLKHGDNYRWFETDIKLNSFLDEENDGSIEELVNIFQVAVGDGKTYDVKVYKFQHYADGTCDKDSTDGFWVEDEPLNEEKIVFTYKQAFDKLMQANIVKPHSHYVTLRKQVGAVEANPQYIFGNTREVVFVDAVNGNVSSDNPAFEGVRGFKMPLGEWP